MKRIFESPTPLAFFGFLLTFLLTVAWRMPLEGQNGQSTTFFGLARASALPPPALALEPVAPAVAVPSAIPQVIAASAMQPPVFAFPAPPGATPAAAPAPALLPAIAQAATPVEPADAPTRKKVRHVRKAAKAVEAADDDVANLLSAATESKPKKRR